MRLKKILLITAVVCTILLCFAITANAETEGIYTYTVSNGEATITDCDTSASGDIIIPESLGGYPVTYIGSSAFEGCTSIASIDIPNSVKSIGNDAFQNCSSLVRVYASDIESWCNIDFSDYDSNPLWDGANLYFDNILAKDIIIPDTIVTIKPYTFYNCDKLTSVEISRSVTSIGEEAFKSCEYLASVNILGEITTIGNKAFNFCWNLKSINIPDSLTSIGDEAFYFCSNLASINIPKKVTSIGDNAFFECEKLAKVYASDIESWCNIKFSYNYSNPLSYGASLYFDNKITSSITIPNTITQIGDRLFFGCDSIETINIPEGVASIGEGTFFGCGILASINIPEGVISIGDRAFSMCAIKTIELPKSLDSIEEGAFYGCYDLRDVYYRGTAAEWDNVYIGRDNSPLNNATIHYNEEVPVTGVKFYSENVKVAMNKTTKLSATVLPEVASNKKLIWTSSNNDIATVAADGTVTGIAIGTVKIIAKSQDGGYSAECKVTVTDANGILPGDINGDGVVNFQDLIKLLKHLNGSELLF